MCSTVNGVFSIFEPYHSRLAVYLAHCERGIIATVLIDEQNIGKFTVFSIPNGCFNIQRRNIALYILQIIGRKAASHLGIRNINTAIILVESEHTVCIAVSVFITDIIYNARNGICTCFGIINLIHKLLIVIIIITADFA